MSDDDHSLHLRLGGEELVVRQRYESASIANDILIGLWFVVGSALFFNASTETAGILLFLLGSLQMLARPAIRLARRVHLRRIGSQDGETARDF
jgi:hypothetical protein